MRISTKGRGIIRAQQGTVARPNPSETKDNPDRINIQEQGMKDFANYWYSERAKQPKYRSQVNEGNLSQIQGQINNARWQNPIDFYADPSSHANSKEIRKFIANGGNPKTIYQVALKQGILGAANPNKGTYTTYNAYTPWSRSRADLSWHEGIGHIVGDVNPQILKVAPRYANRVEENSEADYMTQTYSENPNERHADTWGFRGANVNMKDANGNYYIDPNRQLKGTDIQEMRNKGARIPYGFRTLTDDQIATYHNTFASNTNNKRSNTMLIAKRGVQIKRRIIK